MEYSWTLEKYIFILNFWKFIIKFFDIIIDEDKKISKKYKYMIN